MLPAWPLLACVYLLLAGKEFAASVFAARADLPVSSARCASHREMPTTAIASAATSRLSPAIPSPPSRAFSPPSHSIPTRRSYWFDLAAAYQVAGDLSGQRDALEHALQAEPTAPDVAWEAANFFLIDGDIDRALREFHVVIENDNSPVGGRPAEPAGACAPTRMLCSETWCRRAPIPCWRFSRCS